MKRIIFLALILSAWTFSTYAQTFSPKTNFNNIKQQAESTDDDDDEYEEGGNYEERDEILAGDQFLKLSLDGVFPLNFPDVPSLFKEDEHQLSIGGTANIGYHYFMTKEIAIGFDIGFGFNVSTGGHIFNYVPFIFNGTYMFSYKKWQFPCTIGLGFAWESYNNNHYFPGLILKPEAGVYYRMSESWSLGGEVFYMLMPQFSSWYNDDASNHFGNFLGIGLTAKYAF